MPWLDGTHLKSPPSICKAVMCSVALSVSKVAHLYACAPRCDVILEHWLETYGVVWWLVKQFRICWRNSHCKIVKWVRCLAVNPTAYHEHVCWWLDHVYLCTSMCLEVMEKGCFGRIYERRTGSRYGRLVREGVYLFLFFLNRIGTLAHRVL